MGKWRLIGAGLAAVVIVAAGLILRPSADDDLDPYRTPPSFVFSEKFTEGGKNLEPSRLQVLGDTLFVAFNGIARLDAYNFDLELLRSIALVAPEPVLPTSFTITDTSIVICDHGKGIVAVFDRAGKYQTSFGTLPDNSTSLAPIALSAFKGVAYVADMEQGRVLAISLNNIENVTEQGELVLTIPPQNKERLGLPSAVLVTPDGRLLVGDALAGAVKVFTCDGRPIYDFELSPGFSSMTPQALTHDTLKDPSLAIENGWDPSGLPRQGRYHVVDGFNGVIHMYNPVGQYLGSYPEGAPLAGPAGIAADRKGGRIFVSDPLRGQILVYRFKGE